MSASSLLRSAYLLHFSQPAAERTLYRAIRNRPLRSIVEMGIALDGRTTRLLEVAGWRGENLPIRYTGIDLFDARPAGQPVLGLKAAFAALHRPDVRAQLVPGPPDEALRRIANSLAGTELLLIAADQDREALSRAWNWMPRMLTPASLIFLEEPGQKSRQNTWRQLSPSEVVRLATAAGKQQRRAA